MFICSSALLTRENFEELRNFMSRENFSPKYPRYQDTRTVCTVITWLKGVSVADVAAALFLFLSYIPQVP